MLHLIFILVVIGVLLYLLNRFVPMDSKIKSIINWVVVIAVVFWLFSVFGVWDWLNFPIHNGHGVNWH